jgi:hypothetical protein
MFSHYFEYSLLNSDPIISSTSKKIQLSIANVRKNYIENIANPMQKRADNYSKRHGNKQNLESFNKPLYEWVELKKIDRKKGLDPKIITIKELQLNKWFDIEYINEMVEQEFAIELKEKEIRKNRLLLNKLKLEKNKTAKTLSEIDNINSNQKVLIDQINNLKENYNNWRSVNLEEKYNKKYYDILNFIKKTYVFNNEIINIWELLEKEDLEISRLESELNENYSLAVEQELVNAEIKKKKMYSFQDLNGNEKTGKELFIAQKLKEYSELKKDLYEEYNEEDRAMALDAFEAHKNNFETDIKNKVMAGLKTPEEANIIRKRWYLRNTKTVYAPEFYEKRKEIFENFPESNLYEDLQKYTGVYRDTSGIEMGHLYTSEQVKQIKKVSEKIEKKRQTPESKKEFIKYKEHFIKLAQLQERITTDYYEKVKEEQFELFSSLYEEMLRKEDKKKYDAYLQLPKDKQEKEVQKSFEKSDWYKENHYKTKKGYKPLNIWTQSVPINKDYIMKEEPGFRYYKRKVKSEYLNPNYEIDSFTERSLPKKNGRYDKRSALFSGKPERKNFNISKEDLSDLLMLTELHQTRQSKMTKRERIGWAIPRKEKTVTDKLAEGKLKDVGSSIKRKFVATKQDADLGIVDGSSELGKDFNYLPVRMSNEIEDSEISYDIWGAMAKFSHYTLLREQFNMLLPEVESLLTLLKDDKNIPFDRVNSNRSEAILNRMNPYNTKRNIRAEHIEEMVKTIFFNEFQKADNKFSLTAHKVINTIHGVTAMGSLAWNIPSSVVNWGSAFIQIAIEGAGGEYLSMKDIGKASSITYGKYFKNFMNDWYSLKEGDKSDIGQIFDYWGVLQGDITENAGDNFRKTHAKEVIETALANNYTTILIADHGNCETMINEDGSPNTAHTTNPVPMILIDNEVKFIKDGVLGDIAPTILDLMGIEKPAVMTRFSLIK